MPSGFISLWPVLPFVQENACCLRNCSHIIIMFCMVGDALGVIAAARAVCEKNRGPHPEEPEATA